MTKIIMVSLLLAICSCAHTSTVEDFVAEPTQKLSSHKITCHSSLYDCWIQADFKCMRSGERVYSLRWHVDSIADDNLNTLVICK